MLIWAQPLKAEAVSNICKLILSCVSCAQQTLGGLFYTKGRTPLGGVQKWLPEVILTHSNFTNISVSALLSSLRHESTGPVNLSLASSSPWPSMDSVRYAVLHTQFNVAHNSVINIFLSNFCYYHGSTFIHEYSGSQFKRLFILPRILTCFAA